MATPSQANTEGALAQNAEKKWVVLEPGTMESSMPKKLEDDKVLLMHLRRTEGLYTIGLYTDDGALTTVLKNSNLATTLSVRKSAEGNVYIPRELYEVIINSDAGMTVRWVILTDKMTVGKLRAGFVYGLGRAMKHLGSSKDEQLVNKMFQHVRDNVKLPPGSSIDFTRSSGYTLQTCFSIRQNHTGTKHEYNLWHPANSMIRSQVQSELLCRAYFHVYFGDDDNPISKELKDRFGQHLLALIVKTKGETSSSSMYR